MSEQDPRFGPLHRLDPAEPEEVAVGKLEQLDPESQESPAVPAAAAGASAPPRRRDGMALAVGLAVLLSLSSIAAIGGLVAISADSLAPVSQPALTAPIEAAAPGPTIHVEVPEEPKPQNPGQTAGESAAGPATPVQTVSTSAVAEQPAPPAPSESAGADDKDEETKGGGGGKGGHGGRLGPFGVGGAWCDASPGTSCDVVVGGQPAPLASADTAG